MPPPQALSSGVFELKIDSLTTTRGLCSEQPRDCRIFFRVCLKHAQDVINPEPPCTYGSGLTDIFAADSISVSQSEPIRVPFHFKWPVSENSAGTFPPLCLLHVILTDFSYVSVGLTFVEMTDTALLPRNQLT